MSAPTSTLTVMASVAVGVFYLPLLVSSEVLIWKILVGIFGIGVIVGTSFLEAYLYEKGKK